MKWRNWVNMFIGFWFIVEPWALKARQPMSASWISVGVGLVLAAVSLAPAAVGEWSIIGVVLSIACGFWFLIHPFLGHYEVDQYFATAIPALVVLVFDFWTWMTDSEHIHGMDRPRSRA